MTWWELSCTSWAKVSSFTAFVCYSYRGHPRQKNMLSQERGFWSESLSPFLSLEEESIDQHLLGKLMWLRTVRKHSNQTKLLPVSWKAQILLCLRAFAHAFPALPEKCFPFPIPLTFTPCQEQFVCPGCMFAHIQYCCLSTPLNSNSLFTVFLSQVFHNFSENLACSLTAACQCSVPHAACNSHSDDVY